MIGPDADTPVCHSTNRAQDGCTAWITIENEAPPNRQWAAHLSRHRERIWAPSWSAVNTGAGLQEFHMYRRARPSFEPSQSQRQMVEPMAGCGVPESDIAVVIGIAPKTLRKHFRDELDTGHIKANAKVAGNLYRIANGSGREAGTAAIFWLKVRAGWREPIGVREYPMGKKEAEQLAAHTAAVGTPWEDLLERHAALT